jgi:hypothetical protein
VPQPSLFLQSTKDRHSWPQRKSIPKILWAKS